MEDEVGRRKARNKIRWKAEHVAWMLSWKLSSSLEVISIICVNLSALNGGGFQEQEVALKKAFSSSTTSELSLNDIRQ